MWVPRRAASAPAGLLAAVLLVTGCTAGTAGPDPLILASTTSTQDSGLLDELVPAFTADTGRPVSTLAVGSGQALELGRRGEADVLLVHSPAAEQELVAEGTTAQRRPVMHNDFVLLGPADDPAGVADLGIAEAMTAIAGGHPFVSRGDESGTHALERRLWDAAGVRPAGSWYRSTGQGMSATLRVADESGAYTLTDRATFLALRGTLRGAVLNEGGRELRNVYHVIEMTTAAGARVQPDGAAAFADWIVGDRAQAIIGGFGVEEFGEPLFTRAAGRSVGGR